MRYAPCNLFTSWNSASQTPIRGFHRGDNQQSRGNHQSQRVPQIQEKQEEFVKNEDLSREIHEVTARPISHGPYPVVFSGLRVCIFFKSMLA